MSRLPTAVVLTVALLTLADSRVGGAQPNPGGQTVDSCLADAECARLQDQGREYSKAGQLDQARRAYEQALQLRESPLLLFNLARVLHRSGHPGEAVPYYQKFLTLDSGADEAMKRRVEQYLQEAQHAVATAPPPPPPPERSRSTPVYRKWWLWTAVGLVAVGVGLGIGLGVAARRPDTSGAVAGHPFGS